MLSSAQPSCVSCLLAWHSVSPARAQPELCSQQGGCRRGGAPGRLCLSSGVYPWLPAVEPLWTPGDWYSWTDRLTGHLYLSLLCSSWVGNEGGAGRRAGMLFLAEFSSGAELCCRSALAAQQHVCLDLVPVSGHIVLASLGSLRGLSTCCCASFPPHNKQTLRFIYRLLWREPYSHAAFVKCFGSTVFLGVQTGSIGGSCCLCGVSSFLVEERGCCILSSGSCLPFSASLGLCLCIPHFWGVGCFTFLPLGAVGLGSGSTICSTAAVSPWLSRGSAVIQVCSARRMGHSHPSQLGHLESGRATHRRTEQFCVVLQLGTAGVFGISSELLGIWDLEL